MGWLSSIGSALGGGLGALSGIGSTMLPGVSSALSYIGGQKANEERSKWARREMGFEAEMSGTAYQRAMADMKAAGLNPILAGKLGGASTPGLTQPIIHDVITPAINTGLQAMQTASNVNLQEDQGQLTRNQATRVSAEMQKIESEIGVNDAQKRYLTNQATRVMDDIKRIQAQTSGISYENALKKILASFYTDNEVALQMKDMGLDVGTAVGIVDRLVRAASGLRRKRPSVTTTTRHGPSTITIKE